MSKPANLPEWATGGSAQITVPSTDKKQQGWLAILGDPAHDYFNWWMNLVYQWVAWFAAGPRTTQQILTSASGNYTPTPGCTSFLVEERAGGGQGGGTVSTAAGVTTFAAGAGGQAGGYARKLYTTVAGPYPYTIGSGGHTGTAGNDGESGGNTIFNLTDVIAVGGDGGPKGLAYTALTGITPNGGTANNGAGDFAGTGEHGGVGIVQASSLALAGDGGGCQQGRGASRAAQNSTGNAAPGSYTPGANSSWGGGGSGAASTNTATTYAGGPAAAGVIIVTEYY